MANRGTKKTVEALEVKFETGKKPEEQDFFDWMASFYHKDEDISFLISLAKATLTDMQTAVDNSRFVTAIRVYQSILWHVRLAKLPLLNLDVTELVDNSINAFFAQLMATDDGDNVIDTLGELIQAFQSFNEEVGGINALRSRIGSLESLLYEVPNNLRQVQNTFDSLQSQVTAAQNSANAAQASANAAQSSANAAQGTADYAVGLANAAQTSANSAQGTANYAVSLANTAQSSADDVAARLGAFGYGAFSAKSQVDSLQNYTYIAIAYIQTKLSEVFAEVGLPAPY
jgi:methyl-accepting chemotaxis protein